MPARIVVLANSKGSFMRLQLSMALWVIVLATCGYAQQSSTPVATLTDAQSRAVEYLQSHYQSPEDYVAGKFKDHDIVFLGEGHLKKQELLFLQKLIPRLYREGVRDLGFEMLWSDDQPEIDGLLNAATYDNDKALTLLFNWDPQVGWDFQEYADVLRAAWTLNHNLPKNAPRFRIVATDLRPDWALVKTGDNITSRPTRWNAWAGSNQIARNVWMVGVIRREFIDPGRKALVYNGLGHTTLAVTHDQREETGLRFSAAYQLQRRFGKRITAVEMASSATQNAALAPLISALPPDKQLIGLDLKGTPVAEVPLPDKMAAVIVSDNKPLTLADYTADGFVQVALKPEPVTPAPGFITAARVEASKREGYLPNVPEITPEWILQHQQQFLPMIH